MKKPTITARRLSAGVVVVRQTHEGTRLLLLRAYRNWDFPKGEVEAGETPLEAACREVGEESGVEQLDFPWGKDYRETRPYGRNKVARYYIALTQQSRIILRVNPELGRPEHHEFRWVDIRQARLLLPPRLLPILDWVGTQLHLG